MSYSNNRRDGARHRDGNRPNNRRRSGGGGYGGGRSRDRDRKSEGGYRGVRLEITQDTPLAQDFVDLGIPLQLGYGLGAQGILEPFPIQAATIGDALAGRDVLGRGRTGSGKTFAFGLPLLSRLMGSKSEPTRPRGMILVPTRELAMQVHDALAPLGHLVGLSFSIVIGGAQYSKQIDSLARGADVLVATPGRLEDLIDRGACDLSDVEIAVLDEADQMADMGFLPIVSDLMAMIPAGGQRLLFSATLDRGVDAIVDAHLVNPVEHATEPGTASVTTMEHHVFLVEPREKYPVIRTIATRKGRCIAFVRTQRAADELCDELTTMGIKADALHGGKSQGARNKALKNLKDGNVSILIATDVAARGIHIDDIDLVLNVDMPRDYKDYLHRAGRTARAGATGLVVSIGNVKQSRNVKQLMDQAGVEPTTHRVRASDDIVTELTGALDVIVKRPVTGGDFRLNDVRENREGRSSREDRPERRESGRESGRDFGRDRDNRGDSRGGRDFGRDRDRDRAGRTGGREFGRDDNRGDSRGDSRGGRSFGRDDNRRDSRGGTDFRRDDRRTERPRREEREDRPRRAHYTDARIPGRSDDRRRDDNRGESRGESRGGRDFGRDRDNRGDSRGGRDDFRRDDRRDDRRGSGDTFRRDDNRGTSRGGDSRGGERRDDRRGGDSRGGRSFGRDDNRRDSRGGDSRGDSRGGERRDDRRDDRRGGDTKTSTSGGNRAARRAHLQLSAAASSGRGRKGKPRTKNKRAAR